MTLWDSIDTSTPDAEPAPQPAPIAPTMPAVHGGAFIFDKAVCLLLEFGRLGTRRKLNTSAVDTHGADPDLVHVSKEILSCKELDAIVSHDNETRAYVRSRSTPNPLIRGGLYLVSYTLLPSVDDALTAAQAEREVLVENFLSVYDARKDAAQLRLGPLYDPTQYPPVEIVRHAFSMTWSYLTITTPDNLQAIRADIFEREREKAAAQWVDALDAANGVLESAFSDLVAHMVDRLSPGDDGKPKIFRDSLTENLRDFLSTFDARNIGGHDALAAEVDKARALLAGIDAKDLRKHQSYKDNVRTGFEQIKARLDTMIADRPRRKFGTEEE